MHNKIMGWTVKRIILSLLSVIVGLMVCSALLGSWSEPQVQGQLYETNITLQAASCQNAELQSDLIPPAICLSLVGEKPLAQAEDQYQEARSSARDVVEQLQHQLQVARLNPVSVDRQLIQSVTKNLKTAQHSLQDINLKLGIIQAVQEQPLAAQQLWRQIEHDLPESPLSVTAEVLSKLWMPEKAVPAQAVQAIERNLSGWFRYQALHQLYQKQGASAELQQLQTQQRHVSVTAIYKIVAITFLRGGGIILGVLWGSWFLLTQRQQPTPPVAPSQEGLVLVKPHAAALSIRLLVENPKQSTVPWDGEMIWQVMLGFLVIGQLIVPILFNVGFSVAKFNLNDAVLWHKAAYIFFHYLVMAIGALWFLHRSLISYQPLAASWFSFQGKKNWVLWGLGGYLVATPIVLLVSVLNDKIWHGKGGSNPILSIVLESKDNLAFVLFLLTAAVLAPLFEEYLFRGFLLPSLTRYLTVGPAIAVSGLMFAAVHLSLSELLPLAILGAILGYVYHRTGNLLAPMLLHSLWNSTSMLTLYLIAS